MADPKTNLEAFQEAYKNMSGRYRSLNQRGLGYAQKAAIEADKEDTRKQEKADEMRLKEREQQFRETQAMAMSEIKEKEFELAKVKALAAIQEKSAALDRQIEETRQATEFLEKANQVDRKDTAAARLKITELRSKYPLAAKNQSVHDWDLDFRNEIEFHDKVNADLEKKRAEKESKDAEKVAKDAETARKIQKVKADGLKLKSAVVDGDTFTVPGEPKPLPKTPVQKAQEKQKTDALIGLAKYHPVLRDKGFDLNASTDALMAAARDGKIDEETASSANHYIEQYRIATGEPDRTKLPELYTQEQSGGNLKAPTVKTVNVQTPESNTEVTEYQGKKYTVDHASKTVVPYSED